jgi:hypothetical protein
MIMTWQNVLVSLNHIYSIINKEASYRRVIMYDVLLDSTALVAMGMMVEIVFG